MKKLVLAAFALTTAASVFAQGTVILYMRTGLGTTHVYSPAPGNPTLSLVGNGTADSPSGSVNYLGNGMVAIGQSGTAGQYGAAGTFAQLLAANGANAPEGSLTPQGAIVTFRTGTTAGSTILITDTIGNVPKDSPAATFELVAWDNSSGLYSTWALASQAWSTGLIAAGKSGAFTVNTIGGDSNTPPNLPIPSFNLYFVPEPSTFALAGLGAAAMMIFRRRK